MEYLEGETLARRLEKGPLPLDQALQYAIQMADALATAHGAGITHRDLKPGNIMLVKAVAKVLDFGLAKTSSRAGPFGPAGALGPQDPAYVPTANMSALPTMSAALTAQGTILGTFQYMAPEQIEGEEADARTDIFAFGVVLYEMLTGKKAFAGKTQASLFGAILKEEPPPIGIVQPLTPPLLDRIVRKCLAKDPDHRWQTARDLFDELKWVVEAGSLASAPAPVVAPRKGLGSRGVAWTIAAVALAVVGVLAIPTARHLGEVPVETQTMRFSVSLPEGWTLAQRAPGTNISPAPLAVSPDGRRIAFVATSATVRSRLWVRSLETLSAQEVAGTDGASAPFWSPDSRLLGFYLDGTLKRIDVAGGPAVTLVGKPAGSGQGAVAAGRCGRCLPFARPAARGTTTCRPMASVSSSMPSGSKPRRRPSRSSSTGSRDSRSNVQFTIYK